MAYRFSPSAVIAIALTATIGLLSAATVYAATPSLSLTNIGGGSVEISVNGDANSSVIFYYNVASASGMETATLGSTNSSGSFSTTISASSYNIIAGDSVYVIVDGQQSPMEPWPSTTPTGSPTLSVYTITVGLGQSATVVSETNSAVYMEANSTPSVASIVPNGTQLTVTGESPGSTIASICYVGTSSDCTNLTITVQTGSVSSIAFSENNFSLATGGNQAVTISGGNGVYDISSNSNTSAVSTNLSGNTLTVYGLETGTATITVCDQTGICGPLSVTIGSSNTSGSVVFGETNPTITPGQSISMGLSGGSSYYISSNANASIVQPSINGEALVLYGESAGTDSLTVCASSGGCNTLFVTVSGSSSGSNSVIFGETNPSLTVGETTNIGLSGGSSYYVSSNPSAGIATASVNGTSLSLYGESIGSDSISICASSGGCNTIYVTVTNGTAVTQPATTVTVNTTLLAEIQSLQSVVTQMLTQMQSVQTQLNQLESQVSAGSGSTAVTTTSSGTSYDFTELLTVGSEDAQVTELQERLTALGFYSGPITGFYGTLTEDAVMKYQTAHGIAAVGYVGPSTRAALNAGT